MVLHCNTMYYILVNNIIKINRGSVIFNSNPIEITNSSVCLLQLANCRSQFLLDRLGRCLKLFVSTESKSWHEFASQFCLAIVSCIRGKHPTPLGNRVASVSVYLNEALKGALTRHGWPH